MSNDLDDDVRRLFDTSASTIRPIPPGFTETVLTEGARRRRTRYLTATAGAVAAVLLVGVGFWQVPDLIHRGSPVQPVGPTASATVNPPAVHLASPADWAASLPRGRDVQAALAVGQTLYAGDVSVPITGPDVKRTSMITVYGPASGGWLTTVVTFGNGAGFDVRPQNGIIAPDGTFTPYANQPRLTANPLVVSPDGSQFALGPKVEDVQTGQLVTAFPHSHAVAAAWLDQGIVYVGPGNGRGNGTKMWIWQPGTPPKRTAPFELASRQGEIVVTADGDCMAAGPLSAPPSTYQRICAGRVLSISPHGERVFTESFAVVDVATGAVTRLPVPSFDRPRMSYYSLVTLTTFWEDEDHLVLLVPSESQTSFNFVRCQISTNSCERAGDKFRLQDPSQAPLELSPLSPGT